MARVRHEGTKPELVVRRELMLLRRAVFTQSQVTLPGHPDVIVPSKRLAIFVNGCFWHHHQTCPAGRKFPVRNRKLWVSKFKANARNQRRAFRALKVKAWTPMVIWECETRLPTVLRAILNRALRGGTN